MIFDTQKVKRPSISTHHAGIPSARYATSRNSARSKHGNDAGAKSGAASRTRYAAADAYGYGGAKWPTCRARKSNDAHYQSQHACWSRSAWTAEHASHGAFTARVCSTSADGPRTRPREYGCYAATTTNSSAACDDASRSAAASVAAKSK